MGGEYSSGIRFAENDKIQGYTILKTFDPGGFAFAGKAQAPNGRIVFFKKYKRPGSASKWYDGFVSYQTELKRRVESNDAAKKLCYEMIEFFEVKKSGGAVPLRAFYQVFEWVEGGTDLRGVLDKLRTNPNAFDWSQRVIFARVMMAGINAIHKAGIIHSDLKPENFYLLPVDTAAKYALRVIDMDFSLLEGRQAPWHGSEGYVGTPGYQSPEHLANAVPMKASDVFTCGLILGELLGGGHPSSDNMEAYNERAKAGMLRAVAVQQPIKEAPDSGFLAFVINAALRPDPTRRPTAEQLLMALNGRLAEFDGRRSGGTSGPSPVPASPTAPSAPKPPPPSPAPTPPPPPPPAPKPPPPSPAPTPPSPSPGGAPSGSKLLEIAGPGPGQRLSLNLSQTFGRANFRSWGPDFDRFMSSEQFRLFKDASGQWMIEHCPSATNATTVNGVALSSAIPVVPGAVVALGRTGKCPLTLNLK